MIPGEGMMVTWGMSIGPSTGSFGSPAVEEAAGDAENDASDRQAAETELPFASIDIGASSGNAPDGGADDVGGETPLSARTRAIWSGVCGKRTDRKLVRPLLSSMYSTRRRTSSNSPCRSVALSLNLSETVARRLQTPPTARAMRCPASYCARATTRGRDTSSLRSENDRANLLRDDG